MTPTRVIAEEIVLSVPRSAEIVWRILSQAGAAQKLMAPSVTSDELETLVTVPVGPLSLELSTSPVSSEFDEQGRAITVELAGNIAGLLRLTVEPSGSSGTDLSCSFDGSVTGEFAQMSAGITDQAGAALAQQFAKALTEATVPDDSKLDLETVLKCALPGLAIVASAWLVGFARRRRSGSK